MAFNPAIHTATNKPIGLIGKPVDARTYFYDAVNFVYRAYVSTAEVLAYLNVSSFRVGQFPIIINTGGSLSSGIITGGTNAEWWFKNGVADANLVSKGDNTAPHDFPLVAGTTNNPLVISLADFPAFSSAAEFIYKIGNTTDGYVRFNDQQVTETVTAGVVTGFSIFGHDNGSGKFAESGIITMKA